MCMGGGECHHCCPAKPMLPYHTMPVGLCSLAKATALLPLTFFTLMPAYFSPPACSLRNSVTICGREDNQRGGQVARK